MTAIFDFNLESINDPSKEDMKLPKSLCAPFIQIPEHSPSQDSLFETPYSGFQFDYACLTPFPTDGPFSPFPTEGPFSPYETSLENQFNNQSFADQLASASDILSNFNSFQLTNFAAPSSFNFPNLSSSPVRSPIGNLITKFTTSFNTDNEQRKFVCPHDGCGRAFARQYSLKSHLLCHSADKPHSCQFCKASFARRHDLKRHLRTLHNGDRPFECPMCHQGFRKFETLKKHIKSDEKEHFDQPNIQEILKLNSIEAEKIKKPVKMSPTPSPNTEFFY